MGLATIKRRGGIAIVQEPNESEYPNMPLSALQNVDVDHRVPSTEIAPLIIEFAYQKFQPQKVNLESTPMEIESKVDQKVTTSVDDLNKAGSPSIFTCPDCHGTLWEINDDNISRFRCRVGHVFGLENLAAAVSENVENALWAALRTLEESANISSRLAERNIQQTSNSANIKLEQRFAERTIEMRKHANIIKEILLGKSK